MAWNPSSEVLLARTAAAKLGADRVVVLYTTSEGKIGYASYGADRALCDEAKVLAGKLYDTAMKYFSES